MLKLCSLRFLIVMISFLIIAGCAPFVPSNFLGSTSMQTPQKINNQWIKPRLIPVSAEMLSTPKGHALLAPAMKPQPYHIGAFDNLNIIVWGHPDISTITTAQLPVAAAGIPNNLSSLPSSVATGAANPAVLVQSDGSIFYPYVGHLHVAGLTVNEVQIAISKNLSKYIRNPQVTVQVAKFRNRGVYVLGEVRSAGMQPLTDKPLSVMEAISSAGGINPDSADPSHIYLVRGSYKEPDIFWFNAVTPQSLIIAENFPLRENDIVYVSAAILNPWNRFVLQVLPSFSTYFTIKALGN